MAKITIYTGCRHSLDSVESLFQCGMVFVARKDGDLPEACSFPRRSGGPNCCEPVAWPVWVCGPVPQDATKIERSSPQSMMRTSS